jgi:hypothetical protein
MILRLLSGFFILLLFATCKPNNVLQETIPQAALRADFDLLRNLVEKVHAGAYAFSSSTGIAYLYDSVKNTITEPLDPIAFYKKVNFVLQKLYCLHTSVELNQTVYDSLYFKDYFFPIPLIASNNKLFVNSDFFELPLGTEIKSINSKTAAEIIQQLGKYQYGDGNIVTRQNTGISAEFAFYFFVEYGIKEEFSVAAFLPDSVNTLTVKKVKPISLNTLYNNTNYAAYNRPVNSVDYDLQIGKSGEAYLTINTFDFKDVFAREAFEHFVENSFSLIRLQSIQHLVIDVRNNGGGYYSQLYNTLSYLLPEPIQEFDSAFHRFLTLPYKEYLAPTDTVGVEYYDTLYKQCYEVKGNRYNRQNAEITTYNPFYDKLYQGKIYVLVNGATASAAAIFASVLKDKVGAIIIGEETGGSNYALNSDVLSYVLPNSKLKIGIPTVRFYHAVKNRQKFSGVKPNIVLRQQQQDIISGADVVFNYAFDSLIYK